MQRDLIEIEETKISNDRSSNFRGTASVALEVLDFDIEGARQSNENNKERLKRIFETENCFPFRPENRISAVIDQQDLENAIQASPAETSLATLLENPDGNAPDLKLPPNCRLKCLQGRSRVEAAKELLPPGGKGFWGVDLYLEGDFPASLRSSGISDIWNV
jgi:hypothetical protein